MTTDKIKGDGLALGFGAIPQGGHVKVMEIPDEEIIKLQEERKREVEEFKELAYLNDLGKGDLYPDYKTYMLFTAGDVNTLIKIMKVNGTDYTLLSGFGVFEGQPEESLIIILGGVVKEHKDQIIRQIKTEMQQDSVGVIELPTFTLA